MQGVGFIRQAVTAQVPAEDLAWVRAPQVAKLPVNPCGSAVALVVSPQSRNLQGAWKMVEWYGGGDAARTRTRQGRGIPALKSMVNLLPQDEPWQKQMYQAVQIELRRSEHAAVQFSPTIRLDAFIEAWFKAESSFLKGEISLENMIRAVESQLNGLGQLNPLGQK